VSDVSQRASSIIVACVQGECGATHRLCAGGPRSTSNTFVDDVISPESIPAGLFVRAIYEMIRSLPTDRSVPPNCIQVLVTIKKAVLSTTLLRCPEPQYGAFIDPRPTITEAWFHAMSTIAESKPLDESAHLLLVETFAAVVALLFYPSLTKDNDRVNDMGMSLDGPHSLALTSFLTTFFRCGLIQQGSNMAMDTLQPDLDSAGNVLSDRDFRGIALTVVSLFRACQGALPPWAIEAIPDIFSALYEALGENAETFGRAIEAAMAIRLSKSDSFLGVAAGQLLSGRYFEGMSTTAKESFVQEAKELARLGGAANWRRLKGLIKAICGGKKKDTHFKQKPSPYRWEFDRV
jgi:hypothetical protein